MSDPGTAQWRDAEAGRLIAFGRAAALPGGGFGWLGANGEIDAAQPCPLYVNARMTYVFALASLQGADGARSLAASGLQALASRYADGENGGWFASVDLAGRSSTPPRRTMPTRIRCWPRPARRPPGFPGLRPPSRRPPAPSRRTSGPTREGCALESWNADFTESGAVPRRQQQHALGRGLPGRGRCHRPPRLARHGPLSIATRLINIHARANAWRIPEHYDENWRPRPDYNRRPPRRPVPALRHHPGPLLRVGPAAARPGGRRRPARPGLAARGGDRAVRYRRGRRRGPGTVTRDSSTPSTTHGQPVVTARLHWVACEAVLAADALHRRTGEERFAAAAARWWDEIDRYFLDRAGRRLVARADPGHDPGHVHLVGQAGSLPLLPGPAVPVAPAEPGRGHRAGRGNPRLRSSARIRVEHGSSPPC